LLLFCAGAVGVGVGFYQEWLSVNVSTVALGLYALACPVTFFFYLWDKRKAIAADRRIPEKTLHLLELCGGWPAAFAAQRIIRHKNRKARYQLVFWGIVALHAAFWMRSMWLPFLIGSAAAL
jgi:uncharacterized membrane protein YsdA (DUF1294 family)